MRRFASVFLPRREKRESQKQHLPQPLAVTTLTIPPVTTPTTSLPPIPPLLAHTADHAQSSSSSTASGSIQTPDEESPLSRSFTKKSWKSWLGTVKSGTLKRSHHNHSRVSIAGDNDQRFDPDYPLPPVPSILPPPPGNKSPASSASRLQHQQRSSRDLDFPSDSAHSSDAHSTPTRPIYSSPAPAQDGGLHPPLTSRPFVNVPGRPLFPRSCNPPSGIALPDTLSTSMFRKHLAQRLNSESGVNDPDRRIFASRNLVRPRVQHIDWQADIHFLSSEVQVSGSSTGIRRWLSRPCFEDKYVVWVLENGSVTRKGVSGTSFAVLDIEYSAYLEAAAGFDFASPMDSQPPPAPDFERLEFSDVPALPLSYAPSPSPLRLEHTVSDPQTELTQSDPPTADPPAPEEDNGAPIASSESQTPGVKRGVRWAEDVSDSVPLGYAQRTRMRRADKLKFLREEEARRALEAERNKIEDARRLLAQEKKARERERVELQREREALERDRRQRESADMEKKEWREKAMRDEVTNARMRREAQRAGRSSNAIRDAAYAGFDDGTDSTSQIPRLASSSAGSVREGSERNGWSGDRRTSRPSFDPRIQMPSQPSSASISNGLKPASAHGPNSGNRSSNSNSGSSPGSSRPPSLSGGASFSSNLPSSASHDHCDDPVVKKRFSSASYHSRPDLERAATSPNYPPYFGSPMQFGWNGSQPSLNAMPMNPMMMGPMNTMMFPGAVGVNMMPYMDMPLLPPTPPFMMQQYSRRASTQSSTSSRDQSLDRRSSRQRESSQGSARSSGSEHHRHQPSNASSPHSRRGSADMSPSSFNMSKRTSSGLSLDRTHTGSSSSLPHSASIPQRHSHGSINHDRAHSERGRPKFAGESSRSSEGATHEPSPWTALPTQNGALPNHMPTAHKQEHGQANQHWKKPPAARRQTAFS